MFEVHDIPTINPSTYSLIDSNHGPVRVDFDQLELVKVAGNSIAMRSQACVHHTFGFIRFLKHLSRELFSPTLKFFNEENSLEGDWIVALTENLLPSRFNQVNRPRILKYSSERYKSHQRSIRSAAILKAYKGETFLINSGGYENLEHLIGAIKTATDLTKFIQQFKIITGLLVSFFGKNEGISFSEENLGLWRI